MKNIVQNPVTEQRCSVLCLLTRMEMMPLNFSSTRSQMILLLKYWTGSHCKHTSPHETTVSSDFIYIFGCFSQRITYKISHPQTPRRKPGPLDKLHTHSCVHEHEALRPRHSSARLSWRERRHNFHSDDRPWPTVLMSEHNGLFER